MGRGRLRGELVDDVADGPPLVEAHVARAEREAVHLVRVRVRVRVRARVRVRVRVRVRANPNPNQGMDVIRQLHFDEETGVVTPCGEMVSGVKVGRHTLAPYHPTTLPP